MNDQLLLYRLAEVERLIKEHTEKDNSNFEKLGAAIENVRITLVSFQSRASAWGALFGVVGGACVSGLIAYLVKVL